MKAAGFPLGVIGVEMAKGMDEETRKHHLFA